MFTEDDDDDDDDDDRLLDDFSGHESVSRSPFDSDVTPLTSNGHFAPGNDFIFCLTFLFSVAKFRPFIKQRQYSVAFGPLCDSNSNSVITSARGYVSVVVS